MERAVELADFMRREVLRTVLRVRPLRPVFTSFRHRVAVASVLAALSAAAFALFFPLVSLWLGAAVLGVPHVLSGLRHTVLRRGVAPFSLGCVALSLGVGLLQLAGAGLWTWHAFTLLMLGAVAGEVVAARLSRGHTALLLLLLLGLARLALRFPGTTLVLISHLHALSSVAFFAVAAHRRQVRVGPMLLVLAACCGAALSGALDAFLPSAPLSPGSAVDAIWQEVRGTLLTDSRASELVLRRVLFLYAFGQSLHYAVWLRLMPEVDRPSPVPQSFRRALELLRRDLGPWVVPALLLCLAATVAMLAGGFAARHTYFTLVSFHMGLEAAALTRLLLVR
jgi:hypothetical protein